MKTWTETVERFSSVTDKLGKEIDSGILEAVVALNMLGITTRQSCEGHLERGAPYPWIDIEPTPDLKYQLYRYLAAFYETQPIIFNSMLVFRGHRVQSYEAAFSEQFAETERAQKLHIYRAEMTAFTCFLKSLLKG